MARARVPRSAPRVATIAFVVLAVAVGGAYTALFWRQLGSGLEFDEAWNLLVSRNVAQGRGYTSLSPFRPDGGPVPFDPWVTTGPILLLPCAAVWWATGGVLWAVRLVPLAFFAGYLWVLWRLTRPTAGRWGALVAVAAPLLLTAGAPDLYHAGLTPGRVIGEFAAVALVVGAALALARDRVLLGGLLAGLAVQAKVVMLLPAGVVLLAWAFGRRGDAADRPTTRRLALAVAGAAAPTVAAEVLRLVSVGPSGYAASVRSLLDYTAYQSDPGNDHGGSFAALGYLLTGPGVSVTLLGLGVWAWFAVVARRVPGLSPAGSPDVAALRSAQRAVLLAAVPVLVVWLFVSTQGSPRQGLPAVLLALPVLLAGVVERAPRLARAREVPGPLRVVAAGAAWAALFGAVAAHGWTVARESAASTLFADQRAAAAVVRAEVDRGAWVSNLLVVPEMQLLAGVVPGPRGGAARELLALTQSQIEVTVEPRDARVLLPQCGGAPLASSFVVVVCPAP